MRHQNSGRKLQRTRSHRKALLSNLATSLIVHKRIQTTEAKAKELRTFVEKLITRAKNAVKQEMEGNQGGGLHARRTVGKLIRDKDAVRELFNDIAPVVESRPGGYTRVVKLGIRRGDAARMALIELVDYGEEVDGAVSMARRRRRSGGTTPAVAEQQEALAASVGAALDRLEEQESAEAEDAEVVAEAPADDAPLAEGGTEDSATPSSEAAAEGGVDDDADAEKKNGGA